MQGKFPGDLQPRVSAAPGGSEQLVHVAVANPVEVAASRKQRLGSAFADSRARLFDSFIFVTAVSGL